MHLVGIIYQNIITMHGHINIKFMLINIVVDGLKGSLMILVVAT